MIFGAVVAAFGVAAFVTFYDEFKPGTQTSLCLPGRGPLTAAALAGLALWMLLPQLTVRIVPL
jgi:hypothetical protein